MKNKDELEDTGLLPGLQDETYYKYTKFILQAYGFGALFTPITPKQLMEGYDDPVIKEISLTPPEAGGDPTVDYFLSINNPANKIFNR